MGRADRPAGAARALLRAWLASGAADHAPPEEVPPWPRGPSLVLSDELAVELGRPGDGAVSALAWADEPLGVPAGVYRVGPDLDALAGERLALGRLVLAEAALAGRPLEALMDLQDALVTGDLDGVTVRARPSTGGLWYRVSRPALAAGCTLLRLGEAIRRRAAAVPGVRAVAVAWVVKDAGALAALTPVADAAARAAAAARKRHAEAAAECEACEYADICTESEDAPG